MTKHIKIHENEIYEDDIPEINDLLRQLSPNGAREINYDVVQEVMKNATVLVLRDHSPETVRIKNNGRVIGKAMLLYGKKFISFYGTIEDVVVDERYRGKGLGKMLISALIEKAKKMGMKHVDLTSNPKRVAANNLYQKTGFEKRDTNVYRLKL